MRLVLKLGLATVVVSMLLSCAVSGKPVTSEALGTPLTTVGKAKTPRVSIAGLPNTRVALELFRDNERICTMVGQLVAYTHRLYQAAKTNLLIADGVCYGSAIQATGAHQYQLSGYIIPVQGKTIPVNVRVRAVSYNLVEPLVLINEKNVVSLYLGES
ncbi:MAG: hypothetical protein R3E08_02385 [Thiotrichaceae bacterium]